MKPFLRIFLILGMGFLSLGTVVKKKDPIQMTQTDPVGYQEKLKEEEGGKKGPPAPTLELFPKERFLIEGPVEKGKKEEVASQFKLKGETDDISNTSEETWDFDETQDNTRAPFLDSEVKWSYSSFDRKRDKRTLTSDPRRR